MTRGRVVPSRSIHPDSAAPRFESRSDAGTTRSSTNVRSTRSHGSDNSASRGKMVLATDPPGTATAKRA